MKKYFGPDGIFVDRDEAVAANIDALRAMARPGNVGAMTDTTSQVPKPRLPRTSAPSSGGPPRPRPPDFADLLASWRRHRWMSIALAGGYVVVIPLCVEIGANGSGVLQAVLVGLGTVASLTGTVLHAFTVSALGDALLPPDRVRLSDALERAQAKAAELKRRLELGDEAVDQEKYEADRERYLREKQAWEAQVLEAKTNGTRPPPVPVPLAPPGQKQRGGP